MGARSEAEVVVVGGGVMGTSITCALARAGVRDVVLLEAGTLACGSSGKPLGGVRAQFSDRANVEFGLRSLNAFARFGDDFGADIGLRQVGYLFLLRTPGDVARFAASAQVQRACGVPSRMLSAAEAARLCPYADPGALVGAAWSATDGYARPGAVVEAYARAAEALGAQVRTGSPVVGIEDAGGDRVVVRTAGGDAITTPTVVCATGAWSARLGAMVGVDLPVVPVRRQIAFTAPLEASPARVPFTIDYATTAYFHGADDGGLLLGIADADQPAGFDVTVTDDWHPLLHTALSACAPALADLPVVRGWAGLYEMTPDCNALIGEAAVGGSGGGARFLYATGFSGHGFLQAPAVGEVVRDLYLGRTPVVDVACFDAARFDRGAVRTELNII